MIIISNVASISNTDHDEIWFITNTVPKQVVGSKHVPELAPPRDVFNSYVAGHCSTDKLFNAYTERLNNDTETKATLDKLIEESKDKWIMLVCYCKEFEKCHRSVLAKHLQENGVEVKVMF